MYSARAKHEREETRPASFGFASDELEGGNTARGAELDLHESTLIARLSRERKPDPSHDAHLRLFTPFDGLPGCPSRHPNMVAGARAEEATQFIV